MTPHPPITRGELAALVGGSSPTTLAPVGGRSRRCTVQHQGVTIRCGAPGTTPLPGEGNATGRLEVDLCGLDRLVEHRPEELVATVECGISLSGLQRALAAHGQCLPIAPPCSGLAEGSSSTLGGTLAANACGLERLRFGTARDWVIGATLLRGDGSFARAGAPVVKNVSGYDLTKLYLGAWGSLGVLVEVHLKLTPIPPVRTCVVVDRSTTPDMDFNRIRATAASLSGACLVDHEGTSRLYLLLAGVETAVARDLERSGARTFDPGDPLGSPGALDAIRAGTDTHLSLRIGTDPAQATRLRSALDHQLGRETPERVVSLLGTGISWLGWTRPVEPSQCSGLVQRVRSLARDLGGFATVERAPMEAEILSWWGTRGHAARLTRAIKLALDPENRFPPPPVDDDGD
ncbi:MAG: FAD-binding oxidoreductase [Candidatus Eisenbacteria bacterium]|nr:FAD-binding oxidoreductase [Candidatus Eisenbacteria bacterium]